VTYTAAESSRPDFCARALECRRKANRSGDARSYGGATMLTIRDVGPRAPDLRRRSFMFSVGARRSRMRKLSVPIVVVLLMAFSSFPDARAQLEYVGCSRANLDCYPEDQKRPVLDYLDESRPVADDFVRLLSEHRLDDVPKIPGGISAWIMGDPNVEVDLATFDRALGEISDHEYRDQRILYDSLGARGIDLSGEVVTTYAVRATKSKADRALLRVTTRTMDEGTRIVVTGVHFDDQPRAVIQAQQTEPDTPSKPCGCIGMKDRLRVKQH